MTEIVGFDKKIQQKYVVTCKECGCIARYTNDEIIENNYQYNQYSYSVVQCPNCNKRVSFNKEKCLEQ